MKNISKLNSGETYTLSQIFSNDFTIAIPDLQRDYCWGLETYDNKGVQQGELVSGFLLSLKNKWHESKDSKGYTPMAQRHLSAMRRTTTHNHFLSFGWRTIQKLFSRR